VVTWKNRASEEHGVNVSDSNRLVFFGAAGGSILVIRHMSHSILKIIIPLFVSVLFAGTSAPQCATPVAVVEDFLKAWNSHDAKAFDRLFTADAILVPVAERRVVGHADVIKELEQIHTTWAKKTAIIARDTKIQSVRPDVAVILFQAKFVQDAKEAPALDRAMIMVVVKQADRWRIAAGQVTKQHEGP
jgi:uncharacterized protein (TIGR02246 family)